jgi:hypothetical protein
MKCCRFCTIADPNVIGGARAPAFPRRCRRMGAQAADFGKLVQTVVKTKGGVRPE